MNTTLTAKQFDRAARKAVWGQSTYAARGRTDRRTFVRHTTPVVRVPGDAAPKVEGFGFWKTGFSNGRGFSCTMYTPSTFRIVVGENWKP